MPIQNSEEVVRLRKENDQLRLRVKKLEKDKINLKQKVREWYLAAYNITQCRAATDDKARWLAGVSAGKSPTDAEAMNHWLTHGGPASFASLCSKARLLKKFLSHLHSKCNH